MLQTYVLPPDQLHRLQGIGGPLADIQADPQRLGQMSVVVAEVDGQIVGYWIAWYGLHLEPLWIDPAHRSAAVGRGLLERMSEVVAGTGEVAAFSVIEEENLSILGEQVSRLGFLPAPGRLYYVVLGPALEPVAG